VCARARVFGKAVANGRRNSIRSKQEIEKRVFARAHIDRKRRMYTQVLVISRNVSVAIPTYEITNSYDRFQTTIRYDNSSKRNTRTRRFRLDASDMPVGP